MAPPFEPLPGIFVPGHPRRTAAPTPTAATAAAIPILGQARQKSPRARKSGKSRAE